MKYVYLLQSISRPRKHYIGITSDFQKRLKAHNSSSSQHTKKHQPWKPVLVMRFEASNDERLQAIRQRFDTVVAKARGELGV